jgi:hypothetical protein
MNFGKSLQLILQWGLIDEVAKNTEYDINFGQIEKARELFGKEQMINRLSFKNRVFKT